MTYPPVRARVVFAIFAAIALGSTTSAVTVPAMLGRRVPIGEEFLHRAFIWLLFGTLSFAVVWAARRFPLEPPLVLRNLPAHLVAFVAMSMTHTSLYVPFTHVLWPERAPQIATALRAGLPGNLRSDIFVYGMIVGAYYLYAYAARHRERERAAAALEQRAAQLESSLSEALVATTSAAEPGRPPEYVARIPLKEGGRVAFLDTADVESIEADGDYVRLRGGFGSRLIRQSLTALENQLNPRQFARIHRSTIANLARIAELQPYFHGEFVAVMSSGARLKVSRTHRAALTAALGVRL